MLFSWQKQSSCIRLYIKVTRREILLDSTDDVWFCSQQEIQVWTSFNKTILPKMNKLVCGNTYQSYKFNTLMLCCNNSQTNLDINKYGSSVIYFMLLVISLWQITIILLSHDLNEQQQTIILLFSNSLSGFDLCVYGIEKVNCKSKTCPCSSRWTFFLFQLTKSIIFKSIEALHNKKKMKYNPKKLIET